MWASEKCGCWRWISSGLQPRAILSSATSITLVLVSSIQATPPLSGPAGGGGGGVWGGGWWRATTEKNAQHTPALPPPPRPAPPPPPGVSPKRGPATAT